MLRPAPPEEDLALDPAVLIRIGRVASVDLAQATCTVKFGDPDGSDGEVESAALPWLAGCAGEVRSWLAPSVGEQVLVLAPDGQTAASVVLGGLFCDTFPPPDNTPRALLAFADGARLSYDSQAHAAQLVLPAGGTLAVTAPGGVTITGNLSVTGTITATEDVLGGGKSLKAHVHTGVQAGGSNTGAPQ